MNLHADTFPSLTVVLGVVAKVTIVLALAWIASAGLRRRSAAQKHWVWAVGILGSLTLPLFVALIPGRYSVAVEHAAEHWVPASNIISSAALRATPLAIANHSSANQLLSSDLMRWVLLFWILGFAVMGVRLVVGFTQLARMSARSRPLLDAEWLGLGAQMSECFGVARPVRILRGSSRLSMPLTWGILQPHVILPSCANEWSRDRRQIVLAHEFAHIGRADWPMQMSSELLRCLYWFNPLAWIAAGKLRAESERACDDAVLNSGVPATLYANELLDLSQTLQCPGREWATALAVARPSNLERRFMAILNAQNNRRRLSKMTKLKVGFVAVCVLIPLAAVRVPAQNQSAQTTTAPQGWSLMGTKPADYVTGIDPQASYHGFPSAYLKSKPSAGDGFGTLNQGFSAEQYVGKRIRLSAIVKAKSVSDWAGLWMRVDAGPKTAVSFDNMMDRPIKGTSEWHHYDVVLDVPQGATVIAFGILLNKSGAVWISNVKFETVGMDVPTTGKVRASLPEAPTNLDFKN
jgi:beta-lactamase regulating signal transducer with metallopeptidase domain